MVLTFVKRGVLEIDHVSKKFVFWFVFVHRGGPCRSRVSFHVSQVELLSGTGIVFTP